MKYLDYEGLSYLWSKLKAYFVSKEDFIENEEVVAAALTDLNERKLDAADLPSWASNDTKPTYTANEVGALPTNTNYAGSTSVAGPANKAVSIPFGQVDSTSTATAFTATVDGITELRDGVCVYLMNGAVSSAAGYTININGLGAKPVYTTMSDASASTTQFNVNYTMLFVYNSTRVDGGCWDMFFEYNSDNNTVGHNIKDYIIRKKVKNVLYRYQLLFTCMDGTLLPANSDNNGTDATHVLTRESFNPWGQVYYYGGTTTVNAGSTPATDTLYSQATNTTYPNLRYSFNIGTTFTTNDDIYIKCIPQPDGSAILADDAIVFALPTYEDGFIYKRLGKAYDTYRIILEQDKPVYYYKDGIKLWTGYNLQEGVMVTDEFTKKDSGVTSDVRVKSIEGKTVVWNQASGTSWINSIGATVSYQDNTIVIGRSSGANSNRWMIKNSYNITEGHIYYFRAHYKLNIEQVLSKNYRLGYFGGNRTQWFESDKNYQASTVANGLQLKLRITATVNNSNVYVGLYGDGGNEDFYSSDTIVISNLGLFDLTQMFGTGNEPSTVEEFERMFPEDSYAYDAGRIVNVAMSGMKSLDADGNDLDSAELDVTTLTGVADGESTSEIIFPNGMNGIGDVRDEIDLVTGRAVKRIGVVDMGTLTWESLRNNAFSSSNIDGLKTAAANKADSLKLCLKYSQSGICKVSTSMDDKTMNNRANASPKVVVKDTTYSDAATYKTAMSGVMLYYELDTPIEYTLDTTPSCAMSVVKGGKEMILPYNASEPQCAPAKVVEEYKASGLSDKDLKNLATTAFVQGEISSQLGNIETLLAAI